MSLFKDEARITVSAGRGGDGCVSFRKEAFAPMGGPDGGDGGNGGNILFVATRNCGTLLTFTRQRKIRAQPGQPGSGGNRFGKRGEDALLEVPLGTIIIDEETGKLIADLREEGQQFLAARGGRGGKGNKMFATATHQAPKEFEYGKDGQTRKLRLELKLIADVGLLGLPNAGKSTLVSVISAARPKIADYPFTTLEPQLGIVDRSWFRMIVADIPGIIAGASSGKGLGVRFLKHVERTRVLLHLIDSTSNDLDEMVNAYRTIRNELEQFSPRLAAKPEVVVANKCDEIVDEDLVSNLSRAIEKPVIAMAGAVGENVEQVLQILEKLVKEEREREPEVTVFDEGDFVAGEAPDDDGSPDDDPSSTNDEDDWE